MNTFPDGPSYQDACVLKLSAQSAGANERSNLAVLTAVAALEMSTPPGAGDDPDGRSQEFQHLDNKLNVLIQMFAGFWRQQFDMPAPVEVTVAADGLSFSPEGVEIPAEVNGVELYLNDALPQALVLPVAAFECSQDRCTLRFGELSEDLADALSRHVFRRHRRALAQQRQASNLHSRRE